MLILVNIIRRFYLQDPFRSVLVDFLVYVEIERPPVAFQARLTIKIRAFRLCVNQMYTKLVHQGCKTALKSLLLLFETSL